MTTFYFLLSGTASSSASQTSGLPSDGARQSPRGDSEPPEEIFGPLGRAERLNWLVKKRRRNSASQLLDLAQRIGAPRAGRQVGGPRALLDIVPGVPGEEGDLRRPEAEARQVVEVEILQRVGADRLLGRLDGAARADRDELGRDFGVEDVVQDRGRLLVDVARGGDEADQVLDQRLGDRAVDDCSATCDRRRRRCTSPAPARRGRRCRPPCRDAGWPGGTGSRCAGRPARSRR